MLVNIQKWLDMTLISKYNGKFCDIHAIDGDVKYNPMVYYVSVFDQDATDIPVCDRWRQLWMQKNSPTSNYYTPRSFNAYTSFDMAMADYWRKNESHPEKIMRVERVSISAMISGKSFAMLLHNPYGEAMFICDAKYAFPETYKQKFPDIYGEKSDPLKVELSEKSDQPQIGFSNYVESLNNQSEVIVDKTKDVEVDEKKDKSKKTSKFKVNNSDKGDNQNAS